METFFSKNLGFGAVQNGGDTKYMVNKENDHE